MKRQLILICVLSFFLIGWFWGAKKEYNPYYQYAVWDIFDEAREYVERTELGGSTSFDKYKISKKVALIKFRAHKTDILKIDSKMRSLGFDLPDLYIGDPPSEEQLADIKKAIERMRAKKDDGDLLKSPNPPVAESGKAPEEWEEYLKNLNE